MLEPLLTACASLGWLLIMFLPLEHFFKAQKGQGVVRRDTGTDLFFFFGQYLVFGAASLAVISTLFQWLAGFSFDMWLELRSGFSSIPLAAQVVIAIMAGDFCIYWGHRAQHKFDPVSYTHLTLPTIYSV